MTLKKVTPLTAFEVVLSILFRQYKPIKYEVILALLIAKQIFWYLLFLMKKSIFITYKDIRYRILFCVTFVYD